MIAVQLQPVDTVFFRDGTPYTAQSTPQDYVGSLFPPHPPTVVGALRAALARANGWNGVRQWPQRLSAVLGDGPDDLGALSFDGPFVLRDGQPLFRAPRHLLGRREESGWTPAALLRPGAPVCCDLGDAVRLPALPASCRDVEKLNPGADEWLTPAGMNAVLDGKPPAAGDVVSSDALWAAESRIGLQRDAATRTAAEGMLYSSRHVRLRSCVALGMRVGGVPPKWVRPFRQLTPLGGESRLAAVQEWNGGGGLEARLDTILKAGTVVLVSLSPADLAGEVGLGQTPGVGLDGVRVVSACLERPQRIGGWDSQGRRPLPLRSLLAPGSALFCEITDRERFAAAAAASGATARIGIRREWGFGLVALGAWPVDDTDTSKSKEVT